MTWMFLLWALQGDAQQTAAMLEKQIASGTRTHEAYFALGQAYAHLKDWQKAAQAFRRATELKPDSQEACRCLGRALFMGGRFDEAIEPFRKLKDAVWLARIHIEREAWTQAEHELMQCLSANSEHPEAMELLAHVFLKSGKASDAASVYETLAAKDSKFVLPLAQARAVEKKYGAAIDVLEAARRRGQADPALFRLLADLYLHERMFPEAAECYARLPSPKPEDFERLGYAYFQNREWVSARGAFEKAGASLYLGHVASELGEVEQARHHYREAKAFAALGQLEMKLGNHRAAGEAFLQAVQSGDEDTAIYYNLVLAWLRAGDRERAAEALKRALRAHPFDERIDGLLNRLEKNE
jgi:tetratricopeptide (TPR) repeat protein